MHEGKETGKKCEKEINKMLKLRIVDEDYFSTFFYYTENSNARADEVSGWIERQFYRHRMKCNLVHVAIE